VDLCEFSLRFLREPNPFFSRKDRKGLRKGREKDQWGPGDGYCSLLIAHCSLLTACCFGFSGIFLAAGNQVKV
jgi:hypothetical protein